MKRKFLLPALLVAGLMLVNFSFNQVNGQTKQEKTEAQQTVKYTCPEHPDVVQDKPGKCPKCGMTLVEKTDMKKGDAKQTCDSTKVKTGKMMNDTTSMKKDTKVK